MHETLMTMVEPHSLISTRFSSYAYDAGKAVTKAQIDALMQAARLAPSSYNDQPWNFIICDRSDNEAAFEKALSTLVEQNQAWAKNASVLIITVASLVSRERPNRWGQYDSGAAAYAMMIQANSMGLNAHQMGGFDEATARRLFEIPENFVPMSVMAVGHIEKQAMPEKKRKPIADNFFNGSWARGFS